MDKKILLAVFLAAVLLVAPLTAISKPANSPRKSEGNDFLIDLLTLILQKIEEKTSRSPQGLVKALNRLSVETHPSDDKEPGNNKDPDDGCGCEEWEGCSHGFWKNHEDTWLCYSPCQKLKTVFVFPEELEDLGNFTLMEALKFRGGRGIEGKARILLRQAVAALLNADHPDVDYPLNESEVISPVNNALASLDPVEMEELKDELDGYNNLGSCLCGYD